MEEIRKKLLELTEMHLSFLASNDTVGRLLAPLVENSGPTREALFSAIEEIEKLAPGFYVWFEPHHGRYVLVPKLEEQGHV